MRVDITIHKQAVHTKLAVAETVDFLKALRYCLGHVELTWSARVDRGDGCIGESGHRLGASVCGGYAAIAD